MDEPLFNPCAECKGKCCKKGGIFITKKEYENIPDREKYKTIVPIHDSYVVDTDCVCPFLGANGCTLGEKRFNDCKLYPYQPDTMDKLVVFESCPYHNFFRNQKCETEAYVVFIDAKSKGIFTEKDLPGFIAAEFPNKL